MSKQSKRFRSLSEKQSAKAPVPVAEAVEAVKQFDNTKFDQTVEVAMRLGIDPKQADQLVRGSVVLPHGIGKKLRIIVFAKGDKVAEASEAGADEVGGEELAKRIKDGWTDFDVALAQREMMGQVGKLGRVLGPRGLMPNPRAGTVVDVLLARLTAPILIVREPHEIAKPVFHRIALRSIGENEAARDAAVWAVTLAASGGSLELILVFEEEMRENLGMLLESLDLDVEPTDDNLMAALRKAHVRLHRALQKSGEQLDFDYKLTVENSPESAPFPERSFSALSLVVVALERSDHMSQGYARDCVLHRRQPVLVVSRN